MSPSPPRRSASGISVVALFTLFAVAACASFVPQPGPRIDPASVTAPFLPLTTPITALGDTQEHESTGYPLLDNDSAVDAYVEVAQRPPEQPLFGRRILEWVLERHPDEPFIHLGDVMDLSCRSEADRMTRIFRSAGRPGAILPGNHDGLMFGIYGYSVLEAALDRNAERWNRGCRRGAGPLDTKHRTAHEAFTKRDFISLYLSEYARFDRVVPGLAAPPARGEHRVRWRHPGDAPFVGAIEAHVLDGREYADSFLVQRIRLPRAPGADRDVIVIGLDTNQAGALATTWDTVMGRSPGSAGHVRLEQIRAVTPWVLEAARRGDLVVFAGHHNWRSLGLPSRLMLRELMSNLTHPLVYLSAHTHRGFWAEHRELDARPLLELNVSSLSDWPIAWRRISFAYDATGNRIKVRADLMPHDPAKPSTNDRDLLAAWETDTCRRAGLDPAKIRAADLAVVRRQREARGSIIGWLLVRWGPTCETCEQTLYEHAQAYQDALLEVLIESSRALRPDAPPAGRLPAWCRGDAFTDCAEGLLAERATDYKSHVDLFRRKAHLVDTGSGLLDALGGEQAKAYMTCRAVLAARIDFEATPDTRNVNRGEAKRRAERFFATEAVVGME